MDNYDNDELFDGLSRSRQEMVNQVVKDGNGKVIGAGIGGLVAYASAGAVGAEIAVAIGLTAGAAPIIAIGLGYLAYKGGQKAYKTFYEKIMEEKINRITNE